MDIYIWQSGKHDHDILQLEKKFVSLTVKEQVKEIAHYLPLQPHQVMRAMKEANPTDEFTYFGTKSYRNILVSQREAGTFENKFKKLSSLQEDFDAAVQLLKEFKWNVWVLRERGEIIGLAWSNQVKIMEKCGHLVIMDSTHKTNCYDWKLITLMIMDNCGVYLPGAQMLLRKEDTRSIKIGLCTISNEIKRWEPRYFIVDDSAIEIKALKEAFPGLDGRPSVNCRTYKMDIFLCKVHSYRTLKRRVYHEKARQHQRYSEIPFAIPSKRQAVYQALSTTTKVGCEKYIKLALEQVRGNRNLYQYIKNEWNLETSRSHSILLLQNLTSNVV